MAGGFSFTQAYDGVSSQQLGTATPQTMRRTRAGDQTVRPVSVRQLLKATPRSADASFVIDGAEVSLVTIVGRVVGINEAETYASVRVHDKYGGIECRLYLTSHDEAGAHSRLMLEACQYNRYVRVCGSLKVHQNHRYIAVQAICPADNYNEVIAHILQVVSHHLLVTRGPPASMRTANADFAKHPHTGAYSAVHQQSQNSWSSPTMGYGNTQYGAVANSAVKAPAYGSNTGGYGMPAQQSYSGIPDLGDPILNAMMQAMSRPELKTNEGIQRNFLYSETCRLLGHQVDHMKLAGAVTWLLEEGHMFNTEDDDHFSRP